MILTFATQPAGPWIPTRSRHGTQAWPFLSNEVPIALQVHLKTLRHQQHQPHHRDLPNQNPHASRQQANQANESTKAKTHKKQQRTEVFDSSSHESASARSDRPTHQQQLHTNVSDTHTTTTATSARTGVAAPLQHLYFPQLPKHRHRIR